MEIHLVDSTCLTWAYSISSTAPIMNSTKFLKHSHNNTAPNQPFPIRVELMKRGSKPLSSGIQKDSNKDLSRILRMEAAIKGVENKGKSWKHRQLRPKAVLVALDEAIKGCRWQAALKIFALLRKQHWYEPRCQTYTKILMMLGKCRQPEVAGQIFEIMLSEGLRPTIDVYTALVGLRPTIDVYTALVGAYGLSGSLHQAFRIVEDMKLVVDCEPDIYTYSILIRSCAKLQCFDLIDHVLLEISYLGIECNNVTYNTIIDGYGMAGMFEDMENTLADMVESGNCQSDVFTLNSIIGAYRKGRKFDKMETWYDEFQLMGIKANLKTFNMMIKSYGKAGMYEKMQSVMNFMQRRFFSPIIVTYNTVIDVFGKAGEIEKMDKHFNRMKHLGMKPNTITYCSLVNVHGKAGLIDKVDSIMRHVENSDIVLDTPFFNSVISAYGQAGDLEKMDELLLSMKERNYEPDSITFLA
ncbi:hypothetical protein PIB30_031046 [Stylosanthes scabra]|uniref:Pentatricopeptide repeat-containing protein n=1 Tax=Stylosanthes scabra TaxID=79078 RepID=A0ABU6QBF2_9FABA|nr:hypothetical protein [Stylosanthes scabra]